jgi:hypothetical protein
VVALGVFAVLVALAVVSLKASHRSEPDPAEATEPGVEDLANQIVRGAIDGATQNETGATAAALAYAAAPQAWLYMTDDEVRADVARLTTTEGADRLTDGIVEEIAAARSQLADAAGPTWWIVHPLAWRVDSFQPTEATVSVWTFGLLSAADVAVPQTDWITTTFDLEWVDGAWRVAAANDSVGPTPAVGPADQPWDPEPLDDALDGFTRLEWGDFS